MDHSQSSFADVIGFYYFVLVLLLSSIFNFNSLLHHFCSHFFLNEMQIISFLFIILIYLFLFVVVVVLFPIFLSSYFPCLCILFPLFLSFLQFFFPISRLKFHLHFLVWFLSDSVKVSHSPLVKTCDSRS